MPIYDPDHIEYAISTGNVHIVLDDGLTCPAYWAYPALGAKFPGVALIHDWWGLNSTVRRIANFFAQIGHYVIVPDLFNGQTAATPQEAMRLVEALGEGNGYPLIHSALAALERHHNSNGYVAAVGLGMGGSLAFEAALTRPDLEAAVAFGGFPHRYYGRFRDAKAPILAIYGQQEPHIVPAAIEKLRREMAESSLPHRVEIVAGLAHDFFVDHPTEVQREMSRHALRLTVGFLDQHLKRHVKPPMKRI